jgi:hypothetical protein
MMQMLSIWFQSWFRRRSNGTMGRLLSSFLNSVQIYTGPKDLEPYCFDSKKFVLPKLGQAKILARTFCQNFSEYFVRWATFLNSNQMDAKIYSYQNSRKTYFGTNQLGS